jgi:hypothetical protein
VHLRLEGPRTDLLDQLLSPDQRLLGARQCGPVGTPELRVGKCEVRPHLVVSAMLRVRDFDRRMRFVFGPIQRATSEQR